MTEQDLCQAYCKIVPIIQLKQFIKLNVDMDIITKKCELNPINVELNTKIFSAVLNTKTFKIDTYACFVTMITKKSLMKT